MKTLKTLFLTCALAVSGLAGAALDLQIEVVELSAAEFSAPANEAARVTLDECGSCALDKAQVSKSTVYRIGRNAAETVTLADFRTALKNVSGDAAVVYLSYDVASGRVTEIVLQDAE